MTPISQINIKAYEPTSMEFNLRNRRHLRLGFHQPSVRYFAATAIVLIIASNAGLAAFMVFSGPTILKK